MSERCICGSEQFDNYPHDSGVVNEAGQLVAGDAQFGQCQQCGVVKQLNLSFSTSGEYRAYYGAYPPTTRVYEAKDWEHDLHLARLRCDAYGIISGGNRRILDVGSGSGAFIFECRQRGYAAFGCEIGTYAYEKAGEYVYRRPLEEVNFPVDHFNVVTCHDVLEHALDPMRMLSEMFRITAQSGTAIIDFPNFFDPSGNHHWKKTEHIWFFTIDQLKKLLEQVGFVVNDVKHPIPSKAVFYCEKPPQERVTVLVPPGIGDSYWSIVKMQSFMEWAHIGIPEVTPVSNREMKYNGHARSIPFIEMFPFMTPSGNTLANDPKFKMIWEEAYSREGRTLFHNVAGYNFFLAFNGHLRVGKQLEEIAPHWACNWHPPMFVSLEQENFLKHCQQQWGRYIVCYFPFYGTYHFWTIQFPIDSIVVALKTIVAETGCKLVFVGARWDADDPHTKKLMASVNAVNMTGHTNLAQAFGMLRGAEAVVGFPSGMTVMAAVLRCKTFMLWSSYYNKDFAWYCAPPDTRKVNYFLDFTYRQTADRFANQVKELVLNGTIDTDKYPVIPEPVHAKPASQRTPSEIHMPTVHRPPAVSTLNTGKCHNEPVTILCVLKGGGEYTVEYVVRMRNMLARNLTCSYRLVCLSDVEISSTVCDTIPLTANLGGWWSKLELFRPDLLPDPRLVYFDLDTLIVGNIDHIVRMDVDFAALGEWQEIKDRSNPGYFGSGMMMWKNNGTDYSFLFSEYDHQPYKRGDQEYIVKSLIKHGRPYQTLQNLTSGIYSYKRNCLKGLLPDARIVCFHGRPRPHQAAATVKWIRNNWR